MVSQFVFTLSLSPSPPWRGAAQRRGGSAQRLPPRPNEEQITRQNAGRPAAPSLRTATETPGPNPPQPSATPPRRGENGGTALPLLPLLGGVPRSGGVGMLTAGWNGVAGRREG